MTTEAAALAAVANAVAMILGVLIVARIAYRWVTK